VKHITIIVIVSVIVVFAVGMMNSTNDKTVSDNDKPSINPIPEKESTNITSQECSGTARCITGTVTKIVDGDTIHVDGQLVRFAMASAPELEGFGGTESRDFIMTICPVGSDVIVDEDDSQTEGSFGRIIGVVYCNGMNLNSELLDANLGYLADQFCDSSEFANDYWAIKHGC